MKTNKQFQYLYSLFLFGMTVLFAPKQIEVTMVNPLIGTPSSGFMEGRDGVGTMASGLNSLLHTILGADSEKIRSVKCPISTRTYCSGFWQRYQPSCWNGRVFHGYVSVMPQVGEIKTSSQWPACPCDCIRRISKPQLLQVVPWGWYKGQKKRNMLAPHAVGIFNHFPQIRWIPYHYSG